MTIYAKEPILALWDIVKPLAKTIPIYKEVMHEDENSVPKSYILLRSQVSDSPKVYGDGKSAIRSADCDIILVSKGYADDTTDLHNVNKKKIRDLLNVYEVNFNEYNFGYDAVAKNTQHTFSVAVEYYG